MITDPNAALRPLTISGVLDASILLYRRHFWLLLGIGASVTGLELALSYAITLPLALVNPLRLSGIGAFDMLTALQALQTQLVGTLITLVIQFISTAILLGALGIATADIYLGYTARYKRSFSMAFKRCIPLLFAHLLVTVCTLVAGAIGIGPGVYLLASNGFNQLTALAGSILLLIGGALAGYVWANLSLTPYIVLFEGGSLFGAFRRSWRLLAGYRWRVVGFVVTLNLFLLCLYIALLALLAITVCGIVFAALIGFVTLPLSVIAPTIFYIDLRVRKEAFDLEVAAAHIRMISPPPVAPPAPPTLQQEYSQ